jgi:DNA-binding transcriptional LysR family regulator
MRQRGLPEPPNVFVTSSFLLTLALVQETNAIAPVATSVAHAFGRDGGGVQILDNDLGLEVGTYGLIQRRGRELTPAAASVLGLLRLQIGLA